MIESHANIHAGNDRHYVDWASITAGSLIAVAISTVFLTFGASLGLTLTSPKTAGENPIIGLIITGAIWLLWV